MSCLYLLLLACPLAIFAATAAEVARASNLRGAGRPPNPRGGAEAVDQASVGIESALVLKEQVDLSAIGAGNISYPGILLPDATEPLRPFSRTEMLFSLQFFAPLKASEGVFSELTSVNSSSTTPSEYYDLVQNVANDMFVRSGNVSRDMDLKRRNDEAGIYNIQGSHEKWQSDEFASSLITNTFLASFITNSSRGYVLDLTGADDAGDTELQRLKQAAVRTAPPDVLRCRAKLVLSSGRLLLSSIEVLYSGGDGKVALKPTDGVRWELAKIVLHVMACYTIESFHTGVHLYANSVIAAMQRAMPPKNSTLSGVMDASSVFVVAAILEQAASLHNDHPSAWNGQVWNADIDAVRANTAAIAQYYLAADVEDILGIAGETDETYWWAGGAMQFVAPIRAFAREMADAIDKTESSILQRLSQQLAYVGVAPPECHQCPDVTTAPGLAKLHTNLMFLQSVFHGQIYMCREYMSLLGMPTSASLLPALTTSAITAGASSLTVKEAVDIAYPRVTHEMQAWVGILYGTGVGFIDASELGDGPYFNSGALDRAINSFQAQVTSSRKAVGEHFANEDIDGQFLPSYYFPKDAPKPLGYGMTQSLYI